MKYILVFLLLAARALSATYYIDFENGSDAANGTTTGTPWKHCPNDSRATGVAASQAIVGGDVLAFRRGTTYQLQTQLYVKGGSVGNPVVYDGDVWGTGAKATLTGNNTTVFGFRDNGKTDNVTIRNFTIQDLGGYSEESPVWTGIEIASIDTGTNVITTTADHQLVVGDDVQLTTSGTFPSPLSGGPSSLALYYVVSTPTSTTLTISTTAGGASVDITSSGTGTTYIWEPISSPPGAEAIEFFDGSDNILIENINFTDIGQWQNQPPMRGTNSTTGICVKLQNNNGVTVRNCDFTKSRVAISIAATTGGPTENIVVDNCSIHNYISWGIDIASRSANCIFQNIEIKDTAIYDMHEHDSGNWQGFGEKPHTDGIFMRTSLPTGVGSQWNNIRIHGCEFYADNAGNSAGGTGSIYISQGPSALIYNNVFRYPRHTRGLYINGDQGFNQVVRIYNNTFINTPKTDISALNDGVYHANNIYLYDTPSSSLQIFYNITSGTPVEMAQFDYDLWFNPQVAAASWNAWTVKAITNVSGSYRNFANLQANGWQLNGAVSNPLFTDTVGTFPETNFRVLAGSPAIAMGQNLSAYFTTDKDGNARPAVGSWTVGAYEYDGAPPADTTAPTLVSLALDAEGDTVTATWDEPVKDINLAHYAISGHSLSGLTGSGTTRSWTISPIKQSGPDFSLTYTSGAGRTADIAGNLFASGTYTVTNGSLAATPDPPKPGRRGGGAKRLLRR